MLETHATCFLIPPVYTTGMNQGFESNLQQIVGRLQDEFRPTKIILFGSHAWGEPSASSDVDILVVLSDSDQIPTRRAARAYHCLQGLNVPVEIVVSTEKELLRFKDARSSLTRKILDQGKVLYAAAG